MLDVMIAVLNRLVVDTGIRPDEIGVVTPYKAQQKKIVERFFFFFYVPQRQALSVLVAMSRWTRSLVLSS